MKMRRRSSISFHALDTTLVVYFEAGFQFGTVDDGGDIGDKLFNGLIFGQGGSGGNTRYEKSIE